MVIVVEGLNKHFKGIEDEPDFILDIESLSFELGKFIFIMGHNGSGKSVLVKLMAGEIEPTSGRVKYTLNGESWFAYKQISNIVRQNAEDSLALELSVRENLMLHLNIDSFRQKLFPRFYLKKQIWEILESHEILFKKIDQPCQNLSGGQKQTLAFLSVISNSSKVIFLDEFLSATDRSTTELLLQLSKNHVLKNNSSMIIVSHDIDLALKEADHIIVLKDGKLLQNLYPKDSGWSKEYLIKLVS